MTSRIDRLLGDTRQFFRDAGDMIVVTGSIDMIAMHPHIEALHGDALSNKYDARHDCMHHPLFGAGPVQRLSDIFAASWLEALDSAKVHQACDEMLSQLRISIPQHRRIEKERKRAAGRKDVVRLALCVALLRATDATLNTIVARRVSKRAWRRASR